MVFFFLFLGWSFGLSFTSCLIVGYGGMSNLVGKGGMLKGRTVSTTLLS